MKSFAYALLVLSLSATAVDAEQSIMVSSHPQQTAVVELYTSEGCSSCPPADRWFAAMSQLSNDAVSILPLAFHVDYWDYLGWKDRFGSPRFSQRQRQLGANNRQTTIYTPEFFVNGRESRGTAIVMEDIQRSNGTKAAISLQLEIRKLYKSLEVVLQADKVKLRGESLKYRIFVYESALSSDISRGENAGKQLFHENVVRFMSTGKPLRENNLSAINISQDWQIDNAGIAAVVTSRDDKHYIQAVHTPLKTISE